MLLADEIKDVVAQSWDDKSVTFVFRSDENFVDIIFDLSHLKYLDSRIKAFRERFEEVNAVMLILNTIKGISTHISYSKFEEATCLFRIQKDEI